MDGTFSILAGENKFGWEVCPFCKKSGELLIENRPYFVFVDALSAKEYGISGLCQTCQDKTFTPPEDEL